jgi:hypothetical protein
MVDVTIGKRAKLIGETVCGRTGLRNPIPALTNRVGQGDEFVILVRGVGLR